MKSIPCFPNPYEWVETGWTRKNSSSATITYKFIYVTALVNQCQYTEYLFGAPAYNSFHNYRLEPDPVNGAWMLYIDNQWKNGVYTGWTSGSYLNAGGEVGGHRDDIGMQGGINNLKYRVNTTWFSFWYADSYRCDLGYTLIWNGAPYNIYDWGYAPPGSCP